MLENVRLLGTKLVQGVGGDHINAEGVVGNLDNMTKRWKHLHTLAQERLVREETVELILLSKAC